MHKSINDSSKEGTDGAQKVCLGPLWFSAECGPAGSFWDTSICLISFFPSGGVRSVCSRENYILNNQNVPARAVWPEQQQLLALLWEVGGVARRWMQGLGKWQHSPGEQSHDLCYILAAAEAGARRTWAS